QRLDEVFQFGSRDGFLEVRILDCFAERYVFAQRQIEHDRILENESDLQMQRLLFVLLNVSAIKLHGAGCRLEQSREEIQQLRLSCCSRTDHRSLRPARSSD